MNVRAISLTFLFSLPTSAFAEQATQEAVERSSLQSYGASHPECIEWDDGCASCRRISELYCSTPGIACQPQGIECKVP